MYLLYAQVWWSKHIDFVSELISICDTCKYAKYSSILTTGLFHPLSIPKDYFQYWIMILLLIFSSNKYSMQFFCVLIS